MYDWIVLDADTPYMEVLKKKGYLQKKRAKLIGYMSVGEIEPYRDYYEEIEQYSIGTNSMWGSLVADVRNQEYRQFLLNVVTKRIADKGFDGFFLDTLDSYQLVVKEEEWKDFQDALVDFVKELRKRYPDKLIVLNRGFEFIDRVKDDVNGVLVESLFSGLDAEKNYREVSEEEREWLLAQLNRVKSYGLPVIVVDYVDPQDKKKAKELVRKIAELGFIPYVADRDLSVIGYSLCSLNPKEVWMFKKYYKIF
jgi:uncharacterized protein (TIGR01370 family)